VRVGAGKMPIQNQCSGKIAGEKFTPLAKIGDHLHLAVFLVKEFLVVLGVKHVDAIPVEVRQCKLFVEAQPLPAELFVTEIVYGYGNGLLLLVQ
jgi:hypothetical protein